VLSNLENFSDIFGDDESTSCGYSCEEDIDDISDTMMRVSLSFDDLQKNLMKPELRHHLIK
jgi:hypothetical protein